ADRARSPEPAGRPDCRALERLRDRVRAALPAGGGARARALPPGVGRRGPRRPAHPHPRGHDTVYVVARSGDRPPLLQLREALAVFSARTARTSACPCNRAPVRASAPPMADGAT